MAFERRSIGERLRGAWAHGKDERLSVGLDRRPGHSCLLQALHGWAIICRRKRQQGVSVSSLHRVLRRRLLASASRGWRSWSDATSNEVVGRAHHGCFRRLKCSSALVFAESMEPVDLGDHRRVRMAITLCSLHCAYMRWSRTTSLKRLKNH